MDLTNQSQSGEYTAMKKKRRERRDYFSTENSKIQVCTSQKKDFFSRSFLKPLFVHFLNQTRRSVDVVWINYDGLRVKNKTLGPYEYFDATTFVNRPWVFRDTETFHITVVCNKDVFYPEPLDEASPDGVPGLPQRQLVCITTPAMCSLAESSVYNSEERLFSGPSLKPSFVRFLNRTQRSVDVIWINYDGLRVKYKTLGPYEYFDVNTFVNHPWIFRDTETFDKMVVCNRDVFHPEPWDKASSDGVPSSPQRRLVCITIPVYRLKDRCFQIIRHCIRSKDAIFDADIPLVLKKEFFSYAQQAADKK